MPKAQERREGGKEAEMQREGREGKGRLRREAGKMLFLGTSEAQIFTNTIHLVMKEAKEQLLKTFKTCSCVFPIGPGEPSAVLILLRD